MQAIPSLHTGVELSCIGGILYGIVKNGKVAEWFNAPVLKTGVVVEATEGSTPSLSALLGEDQCKTTCVLINKGDS